ncbi:hypothetical protein O9993_21600 [Vibrio lentus]|nr:hypothetical protein [Vibrio lentus]
MKLLPSVQSNCWRTLLILEGEVAIDGVNYTGADGIFTDNGDGTFNANAASHLAILASWCGDR